MTNQVSVAKVNNVSIIVIEGEVKRVAIKPICEALGVSLQGQLEKLKSDPILSSVVKMIFTTGADKKQYEMQTIPLKYVFGWLFQIDSRKVKEDAREKVLKYQMECYDVLYDHFFGSMTRLIETNEKEIELLEQLNDLNMKKKDLADQAKKLQIKLEKIREARLKKEPELFD